jgi:nucleoid-associated protein YgaU
MATRKAEIKKIERIPRSKTIVDTTEDTSSSWLDYFRFGESYTSLILGIIVVIITTVLLVFLVRDRNVTQVSSPIARKEVTSISTVKVQESDSNNKIAQAISVNPTVSTAPTAPKSPNKPTVVPTTANIAKATKVSPTMATRNFSITATPAQRPTNIPTVTSIPTVTKASAPTKVIAQAPNQSNQPAVKGGKTYTVVAGDTLWSIAEKFYKSGYNWVDIAKANNVANPGVITSGTHLAIPNVQPKLATVQTNTKPQDTTYGPKISGTTYTVQKGDHLWGIAVRAYNDGYRWVEIARVNNILTPGTIYSGTVLKLPRSGS